MVGYSPWGPKESDTTERLHFRVSLKIQVHMLFHELIELESPAMDPGLSKIF